MDLDLLIARLEPNGLHWAIEINDNGEHLLVSRGQLRIPNKTIEVTTSLAPQFAEEQEAEIELNTSLGELDASMLGNAILEELNQKFKGKFVTFPSPDSNEKVDLIYTTRYPADWIIQNQRIKQQVISHAHVKALIESLLAQSLMLGRIINSYSAGKGLARVLVTVCLSFEPRLSQSKFDALPPKHS